MGVQFVNNLKFVGRATSLDSFSKEYGTLEQKILFLNEWFDKVEKLRNTQLPNADAFYSKLESCNVLGTTFKVYIRLLRTGTTSSVAFEKLVLASVLQERAENYQDLEVVWEKNNPESFQDFLKCYSNKNVVHTVEVSQQTCIFIIRLELTCYSWALQTRPIASSIHHFPIICSHSIMKIKIRMIIYADG